ncbi:DUF2536 family protein [Evansella tamaricis]|uniref:YrzA family protein n=1 Tax=Evansella tamaricis TaxID=2069301 RepID=A0ABS6JID8_9BACI|nr:DUF2536 family protein [Evansella tamaricis]MBU9713351.1 YrzA family protein [Evansella tamaricis]
MLLHTSPLEDKVEFFESGSLEQLERQISKKVEDNQAIMLTVHHVSHQVAIDPQSGKRHYSAVVHFKTKK